MIHLLLDKLEAKARRRAIRWLCPDIDSIVEGLRDVNRYITDASLAVGEQVAAGDLTAYVRQPGRSIVAAEMAIITPRFSLLDLSDGTPHASTGYNAPGRWGAKNRRRHGK